MVLEDCQIREERILSHFEVSEKNQSTYNWRREADRAEFNSINTLYIKLRTRLRRKMLKKLQKKKPKFIQIYQYPYTSISPLCRSYDIARSRIQIISEFLSDELQNVLDDAKENYNFFINRSRCATYVFDIDINDVILDVIRRYKKELSNTNLLNDLYILHVEYGELNRFFEQKEENVAIEVYSDILNELQPGDLSELFKEEEEEEEVNKQMTVDIYLSKYNFENWIIECKREYVLSKAAVNANLRRLDFNK